MICFWREVLEAALGPERMGGVAGERGAEMEVWFGGCRDFGRKSPRSTPYFAETRRLRGGFHYIGP